jgi:hypothetical protein
MLDLSQCVSGRSQEEISGLYLEEKWAHPNRRAYELFAREVQREVGYLLP